MEALLASLVSKYGFEIASKMLGLDKQQSPKYTFGMPFTDKQISFNPVKSIAKFGFNKVMSGGLGSIAVPAALLGGAVLLGNVFNPLNPNAKNYSPNLRGQIDYLGRKDNFIGTDPNTGLMKYGPGSVLAGKNVVSFMGTNNYQKSLDKQIDYFEKQKQKKGFLTEYQQKRLDDTKKEKKDFFDYRADIRDTAKTKSSQPSFQGPTGKDIHGGGGGNNKSNGSGKSGGFSSSERGASLHGAKGGLARYYRGGIASLI